MYRKQQRLLRERLRSVLQAKYQIELPQIAIEQPPDLEMGEYALPVAFELARRLKRSPRAIAEELVADLMPLEGFASFEVAGAGYINGKLDRAGGRATDRAATMSPGDFGDRAIFIRWSSTPASIPTRLRISVICATRFWATPLFACCGPPGSVWMCRTTSTTPASRSPTWWSA